MRRVPSDPRRWGHQPSTGRSGRRNLKSFLLFALGSLGTFIMAARAVVWSEGPLWLAFVFVGAGLALAVYYLWKLVLKRR